MCWKELYECVSEAWARIHPGLWVRPLHSHICNPDCPFICHRETFVCPFSSAVHHCTEWACEFAREEDGSRVCPITGKQYEVDFQYSFDQVGHLDKQRQRDIRASASTEGTKPHRDHLEAPRSDTPAKRSSKAKSTCATLPLSAIATSAMSSVHHETILQIASFTALFLVKPMQQAQRESLATEIFDVFQRILATNLTLPGTFTILAATFAVLYAMNRPEMSIGSTVFIRFHPELVGQLKPLKDCVTVVLRRPFHAHTDWSNILNSCMAIYCKRIAPTVHFASS